MIQGNKMIHLRSIAAVGVSCCVLAQFIGCNSKAVSSTSAGASGSPPVLSVPSSAAESDGQPAKLVSKREIAAPADPAANTGSPTDKSADNMVAQNSGGVATATDANGDADSHISVSPVDDDRKLVINDINTNMKAWKASKPYDFKPATDRLVKLIASDYSGLQAQLAVEVADLMIMTGANDQAKQIYAALEKAAAHSDNVVLNEAVKQAIKPMQGRLALLGTKPKIEGTELGGQPLDWSKYKGKVVLLDFWATWCLPCRQELPNVKANYEKYHKQGFDVVGISLDDDRKALTDFLDNEKIAWTILFSDDPMKQGWEGAAMTKDFGVTSIPATFLIDRSGKIVSISARGPGLEAQLAKLLDDKEKDKKDKTAAAEKTSERK
jgi:peroxiredoxin